MTFSISDIQHKCHFAESNVLLMIALNFIMLSVIMLNVVMVSVVILSVMPPHHVLFYKQPFHEMLPNLYKPRLWHSSVTRSFLVDEDEMVSFGPGKSY